jgi:phage major head subunit gpT-like protein
MAMRKKKMADLDAQDERLEAARQVAADAVDRANQKPNVITIPDELQLTEEDLDFLSGCDTVKKLLDGLSIL